MELLADPLSLDGSTVLNSDSAVDRTCCNAGKGDTLKALPKALEMGCSCVLTASLVSEMALLIRSITAVACRECKLCQQESDFLAGKIAKSYSCASD